MLGKESLKSVSKIVNNGSLSANDHPEVSISKETFRRESHTVLISQQLLAEVNVVINVLQKIKIDAHHHVHSSAGLDRSHTFNILQTVVSAVRSFLEFGLQVSEMFFRDFTKNFRK